MSSPASSVQQFSVKSESASVDGNYIFSPPKDEADPQIDRPRLEPLDLAFQNDGTTRPTSHIDTCRHAYAISPG